MSFDYVALASRVTELLKRFGAPVTLSQSTDDYNASTGQNDSVTKTFPGIAIRSAFSTKDIDGTRVQEGDQRLICGPEIPEPKPGDEMTFAGSTMQIVNADKIQPATVVLAYVVQLRSVGVRESL